MERSSRRHQHRSLQPSAGPPQAQPVSIQHSAVRLQDSLDSIRAEFEAVGQEATLARSQRDELEGNVAGQVNELNIIRQSLYELEQSHSKLRTQYEDELARVRQELYAARQSAGATPAPAHPGSAAGGGGPPPPQQPGVGAPYSDPYFGRSKERAGDRADRSDMERDRDRERDRERLDRIERERERERGGGGSSDQIRDKGDRGDEKDYQQRHPSDSNKRIKLDRSRSDRQGTDRDRSDYSSGTPTKLPPPGYDGSPLNAPVTTGPTLYPQEEGMPKEPYRKEDTDWFAEYPLKSSRRNIDVQLVHTLSHESVVCCVRFSADGKFVATGCNRTAQIYDTKTGQRVCVLADETANPNGDLYIRSVCYSPDGRYLATGAEDKQIRIWEIAKKKIRTVFEGHQQEIYSLDFSRDGRLIVSGSGDKTARIWDMQTKEVKILSINEPESVDAGVTSVAISRDGRLVAAGSLDTVVRIWDVQTGQLIERLNGHRDSVYSVAFTPDGMGLVSGSLDKTLKHWDVTPLLRSAARNTPLIQSANGVPPPASGSGAAGPVANGGGAAPANGKKEGGEKGSLCTQNFIGHKDYVLSVAVSHDGKWVVSGSKDRCVQFWDARSAQMQLMLQGHKNSVISIDLSPSNNLLATGSGDTQARLWSFTTPP